MDNCIEAAPAANYTAMVPIALTGAELVQFVMPAFMFWQLSASNENDLVDIQISSLIEIVNRINVSTKIAQSHKCIPTLTGQFKSFGPRPYTS